MIRLMALIEEENKAPRALAYESSAPELTIGRESSNDFQIPLTTISRVHCRINFQDNTYLIEDLGSTHGTSLNGLRLHKGDKKVLKNGDIINLTQAKITCTIEEDNLVLSDPGEKTQAIAAKAVEEILGRIGSDDNQYEGPYFRALNGPDEGDQYQLSPPNNEWTFGRSRDCNFMLNDANVSRRHAIVRKDWNGIAIEDLGSKNGVIVNEKKINKRKALKHRDEIRIGPMKLLFVDPDFELLGALQDIPGFEPVEDDDDDEQESEESAEAAEGSQADDHKESGAELSLARELRTEDQDEEQLPGVHQDGGQQEGQAEQDMNSEQYGAAENSDDDEAESEDFDNRLLEPLPSNNIANILIVIGGAIFIIVLAVLLIMLV